MPKIKLLKLILLITMLSVVSGCGKNIKKNQLPASEKSKATSTDIDATTGANDIIDTASSTIFASSTKDVDIFDWQTFSEEKNGIKKGVLPNFKYPINWYTYNFAGGQFVSIFFNDGGDLIYENKTKTENALYNNEISKQINNNECKISIAYNGQSKKYTIKKFNYKKTINDKILCNKILNIMEKEISN